MGSFLLCLAFLAVADAANILGFFPAAAKSHFSISKALMHGLANKGHNVTVVSFFPSKNPPTGYRDISLDGLVKMNYTLDLSNIPWYWLPLWLQTLGRMDMLANYGPYLCDQLLPSDPIQQLLKAKGEFDIAIIEQFPTDCFLAVLYKLDVPYIGIRSSGMLPYQNRRFANPSDPALVNNLFLGESIRSNLLGRVVTSFVNIASVVLNDVIMNWPADRLVKKHLDNVPPIKDLTHATSLVLINTHFSYHQPRPLAAGVIEIGGAHIEPLHPLPKDLEAIVTSAEHGVIVFSMGSFLPSETMPQHMKNALINVFKTLPQKIIWKFSGKIENLPSNVYLSPWIPQKDLLAHPNVKGFIGHGGMGGTLEAVVAGTPIIFIPIFSDQFINARAGVEAGVAVQMSFSDITEDNLRAALNTILSDRYQANAKKLAEQFQDRPLSPLDTAIYWVEYILKYGPAAVRSPAVDLCDLQYYLIDVFAVLLVAILSITCVAKCITKKLCGKLCSLLCSKKDPKTKKIKKN